MAAEGRAGVAVRWGPAEQAGASPDPRVRPDSRARVVWEAALPVSAAAERVARQRPGMTEAARARAAAGPGELRAEAPLEAEAPRAAEEPWAAEEPRAAEDRGRQWSRWSWRSRGRCRFGRYGAPDRDLRRRRAQSRRAVRRPQHARWRRLHGALPDRERLALSEHRQGLPAHRHLRRRPARAHRSLRRQQHRVRRRLCRQLFDGRDRVALCRSGEAVRSDLRRRRHQRQRDVRRQQHEQR